MTDDFQKRAEELFQRLVELPAGERAAHIEEHAESPEVRREVEELLAHADAGSGPHAGEHYESVFEVLVGDLGVSQVNLLDALCEEEPIALRPNCGSGELPERLGRYQISGEIARGGVGSVWKARDVELGREIALKVLLDGHEDNPDATRRFVEEAQIGAQLQHPGIVPVHDMGLIAGKRPYFAMKLVKGETLSSLLDARHSPAQDRQRYVLIFEQICQPLAYAHARGVIHRDLKPSNVMVGAFGEVQVMDWGLAKVLARGGLRDDERASRVATQVSVITTVRSGSTGSESITGSVMGTPAYMPPEQARGEVEDLDERSDVFGLGAILCEILTGQAPYVAPTREEILRQARNGYTDDAFERLERSGADAPLIALAKRCLAFDSRERPRNAEAVAAEVRAYTESLETRARAPEVQAARTRWRLGFVAALLVALVLAGGSWVWIDQDRRARVDKAEREVHAALRNAETLRGEARTRSPLEISTWEAALEAVRRAEAAAISGVSDALRQEIDDAARKLKEEREVARLLHRLAEIRDDTPHFFEDQITSHESYSAAFDAFVGGPIGASLERTAERIRDSGHAEELALALDEWALVAKASIGRVGPIPQIVYDVDRNEWRTRIRRALDASDVEAVARLLDSSGESATASFLAAVSRRLLTFGDANADALALRLARLAQEKGPGLYWPNRALGYTLLYRTDRPQDALPFLAAAVALNPQSAAALQMLSQAHDGCGDVDSAIRLRRRAVLLEGTRPAAWWGSLASFVLRCPVSRPGDRHSEEFDRLIDALYARLSADDPYLPFARGVLGLALTQSPSRLRSSEALEVARREVGRTGRADPFALGLLAMVLWGRGDHARAVQTLEEATAHSTAHHLHHEILGRWRAALEPDLVSVESIEAAIEPSERLVGQEARWRLLRGSAPAPPEWTGTHFDDSAWESRTGPIGYGKGQENPLDDMRGNYLSIRLRTVLDIPDLSRFRRLRLRVRLDDGLVAWLNGREVGRIRVRRGLETSELAVEYQPDALPPPEWLELPLEALEEGENTLAVEVFNVTPHSKDLLFEGAIVGDLRAPAVREKIERRLASFWELAQPDDPRVLYFEARLAHELGDRRGAIEKLRLVVERSPSRTAVRRLVEGLLALGEHQAGELALRRFLESAPHAPPEDWWIWASLQLGPLGRSTEAALAALSWPGNSPAVDDLRWVLEQLRDGDTVRINCGGPRYVDSGGAAWSRDRFYSGGRASVRNAWLGVSIAATDDDPLYDAERVFPAGTPAAYRIPLPRGRYRVTLHFAETYGFLIVTPSQRRVFDVSIEGNVVLRDFDILSSVGPSTAGKRSFETEVRDGALDIELTRRIESPNISAIEVVRLDA